MCHVNLDHAYFRAVVDTSKFFAYSVGCEQWVNDILWFYMLIDAVSCMSSRAKFSMKIIMESKEFITEHNKLMLTFGSPFAHLFTVGKWRGELRSHYLVTPVWHLLTTHSLNGCDPILSLTVYIHTMESRKNGKQHSYQLRKRSIPTFHGTNLTIVHYSVDSDQANVHWRINKSITRNRPRVPLHFFPHKGRWGKDSKSKLSLSVRTPIGHCWIQGSDSSHKTGGIHWEHQLLSCWILIGISQSHLIPRTNLFNLPDSKGGYVIKRMDGNLGYGYVVNALLT